MQMQINKKIFSRQQRIFVSVSASGLAVALYQRAFSRWKCRQLGVLALPEEAQDFTNLAPKIQELVATWGIAPGSYVSWIAPGDVMASLRVTLPKGQSLNVGSLLPFDPAEVQLSEPNGNSDHEQTIFWLHQDWVMALKQASQQLGWVFDECFARAQLFAPLLPRSKGRDRLLLESDGASRYAHFYGTDGAVLRTAKIASNDADAIGIWARRELGALGNSVECDVFERKLAPADSAVVRQGFAAKPVVEVSSEALFDALIASGQRGIELVPTHAWVAKRIQAYSLGLAVVGTGLVGAMLWHDGELQAEIDAQRKALRQETAPFQAAKAQRKQALAMVDVVAHKNAIATAHPAFKPLSDIAANLTVPAAIVYYEHTGAHVRVATAGGTVSEVKKSLEKTPQLTGIKTATAPDFLQATKGVSAWEMRWQDTPPPSKPAQTPKVSP